MASPIELPLRPTYARLRADLPLALLLLLFLGLVWKDRLAVFSASSCRFRLPHVSGGVALLFTLRLLKFLDSQPALLLLSSNLFILLPKTPASRFTSPTTQSPIKQFRDLFVYPTIPSYKTITYLAFFCFLIHCLFPFSRMPIPTPHQPSANSRPPRPLIPGLPDDVAGLCLLHLPYPYQALTRSVSSSWNRVLQDPTFLLSKASLSLSLPYLFVFAFHESTSRIQWQALDPRSGRWFVLPPMPCPKSACPPSFACASMPRQGKLFVLGGMRSDTESPMPTAVVYHAYTNQWSTLSPMRTPRAFFAAGVVGEGGGRIVVAGGSGHDLSSSTAAVECYDPREDAWRERAGMGGKGMVRYDSAVVGGRMYVTEGWTWPFMFTPRGVAYDAERDTWQEIGAGMREGWTGMSVVVGERLFVISEHGEHQLKVYDPDEDTWRYVGGDRFPREEVHKPFAASAVEVEEGEERVIYVVGSGLQVAVGRVRAVDDGEFWVEWQVVAAPKAFQDLSPCNCQVLYA